jgi:hypothetical protein
MFLNVIMLAGIAGAAVPLLLHLLSRARCRQVNWGAMMFLHTADARQRRSTRLKQWLLLAVRMALVPSRRGGSDHSASRARSPPSSCWIAPPA